MFACEYFPFLRYSQHRAALRQLKDEHEQELAARRAEAIAKHETAMRAKEAEAAESLGAQVDKEGKAHRERMDSLQRENDERIREIELEKQKQLDDIRRRHREGMLQLFVAHVIACAKCFAHASLLLYR